MPVPLEFIRGMLGLLCLFFAHMLGRAAAGAYRGSARAGPLYSWALRALVTYGAILWRHGMDTVAVLVLALAVVCAALGAWAGLRRKPAEDLSRTLFPE